MLRGNQERKKETEMRMIMMFVRRRLKCIHVNEYARTAFAFSLHHGIIFVSK